MATTDKPLAVITGASSGIGFHLARYCIENGYDIVIAADRDVEDAAARLDMNHGFVEALDVDLGTERGVDELVQQIGGRPVAALLANAGHGLGHSFAEQHWGDVRNVIDTNVMGTVYLVHQLLPDMVRRGEGRILFTGSIAGFMPGSSQAVYNATKAFVDSFSWALRDELEHTGVTVTCLMPGATDTNFFARAGLLDTRMAQGRKDDPALVAKIGFDAMMAGERDVVAGLRDKLPADGVDLSGSAARPDRREHLPARVTRFG